MNEILMTIQAVAALGGMVFAGLAYWRGRQNSELIKTNTAKTLETHDLVNSNSKLVLSLSEAAAFKAGVAHADATDAAQMSRDLTTRADEVKKVNGG
jgi:hypothetical protein